MATTFLIWQVAATIEEEVAIYGKEGQVDSEEDDDEKEEVPRRWPGKFAEKFAEIRARRKTRDLRGDLRRDLARSRRVACAGFHEDRSGSGGRAADSAGMLVLMPVLM